MNLECKSEKIIEGLETNKIVTLKEDYKKELIPPTYRKYKAKPVYLDSH